MANELDINSSYRKIGNNEESPVLAMRAIEKTGNQHNSRSKLANQTKVVLHEAELIRVAKAQRHLVKITQDAPVTDFKDSQAVQDWLNDDDAD